MYFYVNAQNRKATAFKKMGAAAKAALKDIGESCPAGADPVATANDLLLDRGALLNLSAAFEAIEESDDGAAQELAREFKRAVNALYLAD